MARFRGYVQGDRGEATRNGHHNITAGAMGWDSGAVIDGVKRTDSGHTVDEFAISVGAGANASGGRLGGQVEVLRVYADPETGDVRIIPSWRLCDALGIDRDTFEAANGSVSLTS